MTKEPFSDEKRSRKTSKPDVEVNPERLKILEKLTINHRNRIVSQYQQIQELKAENIRLTKAIEEAQTKYENTIRTIHIIVGEGFGFQDETTLTWWAKLHQFTEKALSEKPRKEGE